MGHCAVRHQHQSDRLLPDASQAEPKAFDFEARQLVRTALASAAGLPAAAVALERVQGGSSDGGDGSGGGGRNGGGGGGGEGQTGLTVQLHVRLRSDKAAGERLIDSLQVNDRSCNMLNTPLLARKRSPFADVACLAGRCCELRQLACRRWDTHLFSA